MLALALLPVMAATGAPAKINDALGSIDIGCLSNQCGPQLDSCGSCRDAECATRLGCVQKDVEKDGMTKGLKEAEPCFEGMEFKHLDSGMAQIIDCGKSNACLDLTPEGSSLLQETLNERHIPTMGQRQSLLQIKDLVAEQSNKQMEQMSQAMNLLKAHLEYMAEAKQQVHQTTSLIQEVAAEKDMSSEDKVTTLKTLSQHLMDVRDGVVDQQTKMAKLAGFAGPEAMAEAMKNFAEKGEDPNLTPEKVLSALKETLPKSSLAEVKAATAEDTAPDGTPINLRHGAQ